MSWSPTEGKGSVATGGLDTDGDGIPDSSDLCPTEPEDRDGFDDEDGCPDLDNDQDGIPDKLDKCPNEPEDKDGFQDDDGCPEIDDDGDGCPDSGGQVTIAGGKIELPENINFDTGSDRIAGRSEALMDRIAEKVKSNPQVKRVRIEGHTDDVGGSKKNMELSQARAE